LRNRHTAPWALVPFVSEASMAKADLKSWLADGKSIARRVTSDEVGGIFRKVLTVPANTVAFVCEQAGIGRVQKGGEQVSLKFDVILIKAGEVAVEFKLTGLRSQEGLSVEVSCVLSVQMDTSDDANVGDFCRNLFSGAIFYSSTDLSAYLKIDVQRCMSEFCLERPLERLRAADQSVQAEKKLRETLEKILFTRGLSFRRLNQLEFSSQEFEKIRAQKAQAEAKVLRHEEELLEQQRREEWAQKLSGVVKSANVQQLLGDIKDENLRRLLYARLIEDDLTKLSPGEISEKLAGWNNDLLKTLVDVFGRRIGRGSEAVPAEGEVQESRGSAALVACGHSVFLFDLESAANMTDEMALDEPLRSVRCCRGPSGVVLLAGGRTVVYLVYIEQPSVVMRYPYPAAAEPRGGVNSACICGDRLFAAHSELGVCGWMLNRPGEPGRALFTDVSGRSRTTRSVTATPAGMLLFASGQSVYGADAARPDAGCVQYTPAMPGQVSSIDATASLIVAGSVGERQGAVMAWKTGEKDSGRVILRRNDAIQSLRLARIGGVPHAIFACDDHCVNARVVGQNLEMTYDCGDEVIALADASSNWIVGLDKQRSAIVIWSANQPQKPEMIVDLGQFASQRPMDICLLKTAADRLPLMKAKNIETTN
jgi:hypothetical protein